MMEKQYIVERVVLHMVDRETTEPGLATGEIDLEAFDRPQDKEVLQGFFSGHLNRAWRTKEGRRTFAAKVDQSSAICQYYDELSRDASSFFDRSCDIARRLHKSSQRRRASRGLLMVLWFKVPEDDRPFLGLLKMDPDRDERVTLQQDKAGNVLLRLAVQYIEQALPDPRDRVLKWAIMPHPTRRAFQVKAKDEESGSDPAQYFMDFLDCKRGLSEKRQTESLLNILSTYAWEKYANVDWEPAVNTLIQELGDEPIITPDVVVKKIEKTGVFGEFQEDDFRERLAALEVKDLCISSTSLRTVKVEYRLSSGITIKGSREEMSNLVQIVEIDGEAEFRIRTARYRKRYV
jgi:nucleoid-associated protein YejK